MSRPSSIPDNPILEPISNTHTAPPTSPVSITYDEPLNPATVSTRTFTVQAMQTGQIIEAYSVSGGTISLTATDSDGQSGATSVEIFIGTQIYLPTILK